MRAHNFRDLTGFQTHQLTVLRFAGIRKGRATWECRCSCGTICVKLGKKLTSGAVKSCGCRKIEASIENLDASGRYFLHGFTGSPTYHSWLSMKQRCRNPLAAGFSLYGGRGISICSEWMDKDTGFLAFLSDMGERPAGTTLDRIDVNKGYYAANCRWASSKEQCRNTRRNVRLFGRLLVEWYEILDPSHPLRVSSLYNGRVGRGWAPFPALFTPAGEPPICIS